MDAVSQWYDLLGALRQEGFVDDQFMQLKKLQDESSPNFVVDVVSLFFEDSQKLLNNMTNLFEQNDVDFKQLDAHVHQFKGSSASIGAMRVKNICVSYRGYCEAQNLEECLGCLHLIQQECAILKTNLDQLFMLEQQIVAAGGKIPDID